MTLPDWILEIEEWKPIPGFEGYEASTHGRIRSWRAGKHFNVKRKSPRIMQGAIAPNGNVPYLRCTLSINKKHKMMFVHRLVLLAFRGPPPKNYVCAHLNGRSLENNLSNLKWASLKENSSHRELHGTQYRGTAHIHAKLNEKAVKYIRIHHKPRDKKYGTRELAKKFGVHQTSINRVLSGAGWKHI